jgi:hypothetical protein
MFVVLFLLLTTKSKIRTGFQMDSGTLSAPAKRAAKGSILLAQCYD